MIIFKYCIFVIVHITYFCDAQQSYLCYGFIGGNNKGTSMSRVLYRAKNFDFFQKQTVVLGNLESYILLLKSPEFMNLSVSKYTYSAPAAIPLKQVLSHPVASTKPIPWIKFLFYTSSHLLGLGLPLPVTPFFSITKKLDHLLNQLSRSPSKCF